MPVPSNAGPPDEESADQSTRRRVRAVADLKEADAVFAENVDVRIQSGHVRLAVKQLEALSTPPPAATSPAQ